MSDDKPETVLERAKRHFKLAVDVWSNQRDREKEDLKFQDPDLQWDEKSRRQRMGDDVAPARPTLSISKIDQPVRLVQNQMKAAKLGVDISPLSEDADPETAEIIQGLYRHIERTSRAHLARNWAFGRAVTAGFGVYRVLTEYDDEGGHPLDQKIVIKRILDQSAVYLDPTAQEPDFSDGKWAFVVNWVPKDAFQEKFPKAKAGSSTALDWGGSNVDEPRWVREKDVRVAEYWYRECKQVPIESDDLPEGEEPRTREEYTVHFYKITGLEILEHRTWPGKYIPLIVVPGRELQTFDEERRWFGMIRPARDGQRGFNFCASTMVESMASEPKTPWVGAEGQFEGHEKEWSLSNIRNLPYLEYKPTTIGDKPAPPPMRAQIDTSKMQLAMMGLQEFDKFIQAATSVYDPSLGRETSRDKSGKAIERLQEQADAGTTDFLQNFADISLTYEARVILDLMPHIYNRPGRIARVLRGDDNKSEAVMLNQPFTKGQDGQLQPSEEQADGTKLYDLRKGVYAVSAEVGRAFQTRLKEGQEFMGTILQAMPEYLPLIGDLVFQFRDEPGAKEMAERLAKVREQKFPGIGEGEEGQLSPQQANMKVQAQEQQIQALNQQLQQLADEIKTDKAKQEAQMLKAQLDAALKGQDIQARERMNTQDNQTALMIARMDAVLEQFKLAQQGQQAEQDREHEGRMVSQEHQREDVSRMEDRAHEVGMAAGAGKSVTFSREGGREGEREQEAERSAGRTKERSQEQGAEQGDSSPKV
jgi:hypothetical protein